MAVGIQSLPVQCSAPLLNWGHRGTSTCIWLVYFPQLHVRQCPNVGVVCDLGCGAQFPRCCREQHASECPKRLTSCSYCGLAVSMDTLQVGCCVLWCVCVCVCVCWCTSVWVGCVYVAMVGCCVHTLVLRDREFVCVSAKTDSSASLHVGYTNL